MKTQLWKPILAGIAIGAALYFIPFFFFRGFFFFLFAVLLIRLFWFGRHYRHGWHHQPFHPRFADTIRNMSPDEYEEFKKGYYHRCYDDQPKEESKPSANK